MKLLADDTEHYRQLLASLLWLAIHDACQAPLKAPGKSNVYRPTDHALDAIRFIFNDKGGSYFNKYIECLGMEADAFRQKLIRTMYTQEYLQELPYGGLPVNAHKSFRFNHTYWLTHESPQKGELNAVLRKNRRHLSPSIAASHDLPLGSDDVDQGTNY